MGKAALPASRVGTAVGADPPPVDGAAVGEVVTVELLATGVAVADEPQANSRTTNNRTIALGQCFMICLPDLDSDILPSPTLRIAVMFFRIQVCSTNQMSQSYF